VKSYPTTCDLFPVRIAARIFSLRWRYVYLFVLMLATLLAPVGSAKAADDAQKSADVERLIANDSDVAALKAQLSAKQISNVDYTKRLQGLTKARNDILAGYDRNGQRELVALYNAAKKDLAVAARQAAVEKAQAAKEEAARKAQQARETAAAEAKAKVEAAQQAVAAEKQAVEDDAHAYLNFVMLHDRLVVKESVQGPDEADKKQMAEYLRQGLEVRNKYAKGAPLAAHTNELGARIQQLDKELVVPAAKEWLAEALPSPDQVLAAYDDVEKRAGALRFMDRVLRDNVAAPWPDTVSRKSAAYVAAVDKIDPPNGPQHSVVARRADELVKDPEFRIDAAKKLLGFYGVPYVQSGQAEIKDRQARAEWNQIGFKSNFIFLAVLLVPVVFLLIGQSSKTSARSGDGGAFDLPEPLRVVKVFRKKYRVDFDSGRIYDKEVWTETTTTTTTTAGSTTYSGGIAMASTPASTTTTSSTTVYHRYWIRTPDGREVWRKFSDKVFLATNDQIISTLDFKSAVLVAYNHTTDDFVPLRSGFNAANRLPGRWLWLASCAVGSAGFFLLKPPGGDPNYINPEGHPWNHVVSAGITGVVIGSLINVVLFKIVVQFIRNRQFKKQYVPRLAGFLKELSPGLVRHYGDQTLTRGTIEKA
jgi:hypothetical protein